MESIEILLDDGLDARIRSEWTALADAGLPSQADHRGESNRPHVTAAVRPALPRLENPSRGRLPLTVGIGPVLVLGRAPRLVVARLVVPTAELVALHVELHERLGPGDDAPHSSPGSWTPHVTLARGVSLDLLPRALAVVDPRATHAGTLMSIRHWDGIARVETSLD